MTTISPSETVQEISPRPIVAPQPLLTLALGEEAVVRHIPNRCLAGRLAALGLLPGTRLSMLRKRKKDPVLIWARNTRIALAQDIAGQILIQQDGAA